jgi:hypothetical protein
MTGGETTGENWARSCPRHAYPMAWVMAARGMRTGGQGRQGTVHAAVQARGFSPHGNRPVNVQCDVARPTLNTVAVLKVLRQALYEFREDHDWQRHKKYDTSPMIACTSPSTALTSSPRASKALGELETIVKACEGVSRT